MRLVNNNIFIDTNIILYAYSKTELEKSEIANKLIFKHKNSMVSNQVLNETINILYKKYQLNSEQIENVILEMDRCLNICKTRFSSAYKFALAL